MQAHPEIVQGTAELHHEIADARLPQADAVFHDATALHTAVHMLAPQPPLVELLVCHVLLPRELLQQIEINSFTPSGSVTLGRSVASRQAGRALGYGSVEMPNATEAQAAMAGLQGTTLEGRLLTVTEAYEREGKERRLQW